ncbi:MAG: hypothetical protein EAZ92_03125 [Candidatus Kapaibacterium sp.]|nr:MAG: hypothetical protein EAZ92_03125 [Candidatus Kapabacteria bacterium]
MSKAFETIRRTYTGLSLIILNTALFLVLTVVALEFVAGWLLNRQASAQNTAVSLTESAYEGMAWKDQFFKDVAAYQAATGGAQVYEPYSLWKNPDYATPTFTVEQGYRKTVQTAYNQDDSAMTVWMFGGSTMFCADTPDDWTISSRLAAKLKEAYPDRKFVIQNYGLPGFVNDQEAVLLSKLLMQGKRPDAVIFYDGFNEGHLKVAMTKPMAHGFYNLYDQIYRSIKERLWANLVWKSSLLTLVMRSRNDGIKFEKDENVLKARSEAVSSSYANTLTFVQNLAKTYNFKAYFFWQPSLLTTQKTLTEKEAALQKMMLESNGKGYGILLETVRAKTLNNPQTPVNTAFDINNALDSVKETAFVDYAHLGPRGNDAIAEAMLQHLKTSGF